MNKILINAILGDQKIGLIDVGSSGGLEHRWARIEDRLNCFMFEPDERSYQEIVEEISNKKWKIYPVALSNNSEISEFYLCRKPQVSSLYLPNREILDKFPNKIRWDVINTTQVNLSPLDNVINDTEIREQCDFIKLDVQGGELSVLQGSIETLDYILGIECEVEFIRIYHDQPLFGDVCAYLDELGFSFIDFISQFKWDRTNYVAKRGQLIFADALFLKSPESVVSQIKRQFTTDKLKARNKLKRYMAICALYEKTDYIQFILDNYSDEFEISYNIPIDEKYDYEKKLSIRNILRKILMKLKLFLGKVEKYLL